MLLSLINSTSPKQSDDTMLLIWSPGLNSVTISTEVCSCRQGNYSVANGSISARSNQAASSMAFNGARSTLETVDGSGLCLNPTQPRSQTKFQLYDSVTEEITYDAGKTDYTTTVADLEAQIPSLSFTSTNVSKIMFYRSKVKLRIGAMIENVLYAHCVRHTAHGLKTLTELVQQKL